MDKVELHHALSLQWAQQQSFKQVIAQRLIDIFLDIQKPEVSVITGVRRCGKSSFLKQLRSSVSDNYAVMLVEFDDPNLDGFSGSDFTNLVSCWEEMAHPGSKRRLYLFDEIQNVKEWEKWIPHLAKNLSTKIIITGSNAQLLSSELGTLLTGRHISHEMTPLGFLEVVQLAFPATSLKTLSDSQLLESYTKYFQYGGFPRAYLDNDISILPRYFADILERDIIVRHGARLTRPLKELARFLCANNTRLVNRKRLAKELGIKDEGTVKRYCEWLEESYLFYEVKGFSASVKKQMRSSPKFYCVDPILARSSAFSITSGEGAFLENAVYLELRRRGCEIHYWQAESVDVEVDFITRKPGNETTAIQASLTVIDENTLEREVRGLVAAHNELGIKNLLLITKNETERKLSVDGVTILVVPFIRWGLEPWGL